MTTTPRAQRLVARAWIRKMANGESGGSQPHLFSTDDGEYMVKVLNNPQGSYVLANELMAGLCLHWLGGRHTRTAVVDVPQSIISATPDAKFDHGAPLDHGLAFGSEYVQSLPQDAADASLIDNLADVAAAMVLDTWLWNTDSRQYRLEPSTTSPGRYRFVPVDQGHCFNANWTPDTLNTAPAVGVVGPATPVSAAQVAPISVRLRTFTSTDAGAIVDEVPDPWLDAPRKVSVADFMLRRAAATADVLDAAYPNGS